MLVIGSAVIALVCAERLQGAFAKEVLMGSEHRLEGGRVFHPEGATRADQEEIAADSPELKGPPELQPLGDLALVEAGHSFGMEGESFVSVDLPPTQETRHTEKELRAALVGLLPRPTNVPGHVLDIVVEQSIEIFSHVANLAKGFVPKRLQGGRGLVRRLAITKKVGFSLGFDCFDVDARNEVGEE